MAEVICVGMACADVVLRGVDLNKAPASYDRHVPVKSTSIAGGGDALNEAIVLGYLGHHVRLMAGRGDDGAGAIVAAMANKANVDMGLCNTIPGYCTPVSAIMVDESADKMFFRPPAGSPGSFLTHVRFVPDIADIKDVKVVSLASLFTSPLDDVALTAQLAKKAKAEGAIVCADTKPLRDGMMLSDYREALPYIDYFFPNESEAAQFAPDLRDTADMAAYFQSFGIKNAVIKIGERGALFFGEHEHFHMPAYQTEAVDTTGCGDNFAAGFISGLLQGMDARGCCAFATAAASICLRSVGASTGVTSRQQVNDRYNEIKLLHIG